MTRKECIALLIRYAEYDGMGIPNLAGCRDAMRTAAELLQQPSLPSNLDEAVQPEWRKAPISFMGGAIIKTSIGPMYSDHVVAGQLYLKFEELHLLPGYDEN